MDYDVIVPQRFLEPLRHAAFNGAKEGGAWALFSSARVTRDPVNTKPRHRYILRHIQPFAVTDTVSSSPKHITVKTDTFMPILRQAQCEGLTPGFLHGHPSGYSAFSMQDDMNEKALTQATRNRNGPEAGFVSLLVLPDDTLKARVWHGDCMTQVATVLIAGSQVRIMDRHPIVAAHGSDLDRQARVFGDLFNDQIRALRVLIVGAGGTGSPLAVMLARAGVRCPVIVDPDIVEDTNLHRLHGARVCDIGRAKAEVIVDHINGMGLETGAIGIQGNILDAAHRDLLVSADLIFCCTDDHAGRLLLNRFAYFYEIPVVDIGLAIERTDMGIRDMTGRVTTLHPGAACLLCRNIVDPSRARAEELRRCDPEAFLQQVDDGYILGGGIPEPAFISMTTSVATMAMEEMLQLMTGFRGAGGSATQRLRRFQIPEDRRTGAKIDPDCPICGESEIWGIGDITPFLDRVA